MMSSSNGPISSQNGCTQPPRRKSLVGSSSGPPGACMTPSSETKTAPVSLRIDGLVLGRGLDVGDDDLLLLQHRVERAFGLGRVLAGRQLHQPARRDLPEQAE